MAINQSKLFWVSAASVQDDSGKGIRYSFCKAGFALATTSLYSTVRRVAEGDRDYIFI
jgi:hypothetical protein